MNMKERVKEANEIERERERDKNRHILPKYYSRESKKVN